MASNFQVKTKSKSLRCEICHQVDQFDVETETCLRCQGLVISNLIPQQSNNHFQDWMVNLGSINSESPFPSREIFTVLRQALGMYWQKFFLFFLLTISVLVPLSFLTEDLVRYQLGVTDSFYQIIIIYIVPFLITPLAMGTINLAVFEHQQRQEPSFLSLYRKFFSRGLGCFGFILTSLVGQIYQLIGLLFCWLGVLYTYPSGAFVSETAIIEQRYGFSALKSSHKIGMRIPVFLLFLGLFNFVLPKLGANFIAHFFVNKTLYYGIGLEDLTYILLTVLQVFTFPLVLIIKILMYLRLRPQEQETNQPASNSNTTTFRLR